MRIVRIPMRLGSLRGHQSSIASVRLYGSSGPSRKTDPSSPEPGFRVPQRLAVRYFKAGYDKFMSPETITDEPGRWEITLHLREDCPYPECTTDVTPRRCQRFRAKPGERFTWTSTPLGADRPRQSGKATADKWGLVTVEKVTVGKTKTRLKIVR